jgi:DNA polymerase III epsilon subunit-like protein
MIAIDVESSSPDTRTGSILSLGAVDTDNQLDQFYDECRIWDGAHVADEALAVNGFTKEEISDPQKKSEKELVEAFIAWAYEKDRARTLVAQNPSFDRDYVKMACFRAGVEFPFADRTIDTHTLTWLHITLAGEVPPTAHDRTALSLDQCLKHCGIPEEPKPHNALTGALSHAEVFARIAYTKSILPEFSQFPIPWK